MVTPVAKSEAHNNTVQAIELMSAALTLLKAAYQEPSLEPSPEEMNLIRAAKSAESALSQVIASVGRHCEYDALPAKVQNQLQPKSAASLLEELRQEQPIAGLGL